MSYQPMTKKEAELEVEIEALRDQARALLAQAEQVDAAEDERYGADRRGDELPAELIHRESRLVRLREAKAALEAEAEEREQSRRQMMKAEGKTPRTTKDGRDRDAPTPSAQRNFTDPDSKIMKTSDGAFHQCYNAQAIVDSTAQVIVSAELSSSAPDCPALVGALEQLSENLARIQAELPQGATLAADAGYFSFENIAIGAERGLDTHIASGRQKHSNPPPIAPRGPIPKDTPPGSGWHENSRRNADRVSTHDERRSLSRSSARCKPSRTPNGC